MERSGDDMTGGGGDRSLPCVLEPFKAVCPTATRPKNAAGRGGSPRPGPSLGPPTSTYSVRSVIPGPRVLRRPRAERQPQAQPQQQEHGGGQSAAVHWDQAGRARGTAPRLQTCSAPPPSGPRPPRAPPPAPARPASTQVPVGSQSSPYCPREMLPPLATGSPPRPALQLCLVQPPSGLGTPATGPQIFLSCKV